MKLKMNIRTIGTMLSSVIAKKYGLKGLKDDTIIIDFEGICWTKFWSFFKQGYYI